MRIDKSKKMRSTAGENIVIVQAGNMADLTHVVAFNESALELYDRLKDSDFTVDDVAQVLTDIYDVDAAAAAVDAAAWVKQMREQGLILD